MNGGQAHMTVVAGPLKVFGFDMRHPWNVQSIEIIEIGDDVDPTGFYWMVIEATCPRCGWKHKGEASLESIPKIPE